MTLGVEGITMSPGYSYQHAPRQDVFLGRTQVEAAVPLPSSSVGRRRRKWRFNHSSLFLDFLAGNKTYQCTPWSNPTYNVFGWQKPCYLLVGRGLCAGLSTRSCAKRIGIATASDVIPKCDNCMAHCGYEGTAVNEHLCATLDRLLVIPARSAHHAVSSRRSCPCCCRGDRAERRGACAMPVEQIGMRDRAH